MSSFGGPNGVGYNTADNTAQDPWQFIGASFEGVGTGTFISLNSLSSPEGIEDGNQIQIAHCDESGTPYMKDYEYWDGDGWVDLETSTPLDADFALVTAGKGFWFFTTNPEESSFTEVSPISE